MLSKDLINFQLFCSEKIYVLVGKLGNCFFIVSLIQPKKNHLCESYQYMLVLWQYWSENLHRQLKGFSLKIVVCKHPSPCM